MSVRPGEQVIVVVGVMAPEMPGNLVVEYDLVHELRWFNCPRRIKMQVLPKPPPDQEEI